MNVNSSSYRFEMIRTVCAIVLILKSTSVKSDIFLPKDTSYGYVPRDSKIVKYPKDQDTWKPFTTESYQESSDTIVVEAITSKTNESNAASDNVTHEESIKKRTSKFSRYAGGPYFYEPPSPPQYLPPPSDTIPSDYPTPSSTDEEFINKPSHDEIPQDVPDVPFQGYNYDIPDTPFQPPVSHDEAVPVIPSQGYLPIPPSNILETPLPFGGGIAKAHLDSDINTKHSIFQFDSYGSQQKQKGPLRIEVNEMHCFSTSADGRFHAVLTIRSPNENLPVFEDILQPEVSRCTVKSDVLPPRINSKIRLNILKSQFNECAVKDCSTSSDVVHLCIRLRFPTIPKMKLAEDPVLTLQCRTQDRIAAHTKHLAINVENSASGRSNDVAKGGARGGLRSRVSLFRRGPRGEHNEPLPRGARVPLGEIMMLKAQIEPEDGWLASRLSSVSLSGGNGGSMTLLGPDGCRDPRAQALCPKEARPAPPLGHSLFIRAALFEGMRSGEEVRLSVRLVACLDPSDCKAPKCPHSTLAAGRTRRTAAEHSVRPANQTLDTTSVISFKVILPDEADGFEDDYYFQSRNRAPVIIMLMILSTTIVCSSVMIFLKKKGHWCDDDRHN